ncbi:hypothetical protein WJX73_007846 [Symbiochloris irregularis]|uniref:Uncharacterized protein n=1 Tax=Symbiochloris irregularis TaxID=706552 RepID=A0AAW1PJ62_9CHLO
MAGPSASQTGDDVTDATEQDEPACCKHSELPATAFQEASAASGSADRCSKPAESESTGRTSGASVGHHHVSFQMPAAAHSRRRGASLARASCPPTPFHDSDAPALGAPDLRGKPPLSGSSNGCHMGSISPGQDLCLPRFSIPESEPVSVPRVRSASDISAMLLPVRKAYPSMEFLAPAAGSPDSNPHQTLDDKTLETQRSSCSSIGETLSPQDQSSILSISNVSSPCTTLPSTQESEEGVLLMEAAQKPTGSPRRVRSLPTSPAKQGPSEAAPVPQPKQSGSGKPPSPRGSGEWGRAERSENGRVHGASSCSLTSHIGSSDSLTIPQKASGQSRGDWLHVSNSEGSFGLLRRSLSQLTGRMSMSPSTHWKAPHSLQTTLNPWSDEDASHGSMSSRGEPCSREPSVASGMASPSLGSNATKLHGGSGALQALRLSSFSNHTVLNGLSSERSSHEFDEPEFAHKRRGSCAALQALLDSADGSDRGSFEKRRSSGSHDYFAARSVAWQMA